jgi:GH15 family glucan-1,4-alpha-glucosidase
VPAPIEDYALIGDLQTAALVCRDGSIDWCCFPRFDSDACFAALLGEPHNGRWLVSPKTATRSTGRRYRRDTLVLETEFRTDDGAVRVIDFMPPRGEAPDIVRIVEGLRGQVEMRSELIIRFDYGTVVPWVRRVDHARVAIAGPNALCLRTPVEVRGEDMTTVSEFTVTRGDRVPFVLTWFPSHHDLPDEIDPEQALRDAEEYWREWADGCQHTGQYHDDVSDSLIVLKALTYAPTGGIVAAPTTSLPELIGGIRNWDYRFCWLRDATLTLLAMLNAGFKHEASDWRDWLMRAIAGDPADIQTMYGIAGERRLEERELEWLPGYEGSAPVRIGNAASNQLQLDVFGEVVDALYQARVHDVDLPEHAWAIVRGLMQWLEYGWRRADSGIWEVRGDEQHFTYSKVMTWVAFDRACRLIEEFGLEGPLERWQTVRNEIHAEVCERTYRPHLGTFTRSFESEELDGSLLLLPLVGFLPPTDPRIVGTVEAIRSELVESGFVRRYLDEDTKELDGLPPKEGVFLACTFWLADVLALQGKEDEAQEIFERLLALRNDVGLMAEEYDPDTGRMVGNFPQAFTHLALVNTAFILSEGRGMRQTDG